jgi:ATP-dependent DNA ligase
MLARPADKLPASDDYVYEVKWDGLRALISLDEEKSEFTGATEWR